MAQVPSLPTSLTPLLPIGRRILHSLQTLPSPSLLPSLLSTILSHNLHLNSTISSSFFIISLRLSHTSLRLPLRLLSLLPLPPPPFPTNTLLRSLLPSHPHLLPHLFLQLLHSSFRPNRYTYPPLLKSLSFSSSSSSPHPVSLWAHSRLLKEGLSSDSFVTTSLLSFYSHHHDFPSARQLFDQMPRPDVSTWTALISSDRTPRALLTFERMHYAGVAPNRVTLVAALSACAANGNADMGAWIHAYIRRKKWRLDVVMGTALVDMYGKCGKVEDGLEVFLSMEVRNAYTWNSLIGGFALAKSGKDALMWFERMEADGVRPDAVTLIGVLSACSHSRMVEEGRRIFRLVESRYYGFPAGIKHYGCFVDLLGRAGCLDEALRCMETMPFEPGVVMWGSFLAGCRAHGDLRLGEVAARRLVELEPENVAHYVLLSNLYAEMGRWRDAEEVRSAVKERGMRKDAGWSFAEPSNIKDRCADEPGFCNEIARVGDMSVPEPYKS